MLARPPCPALRPFVRFLWTSEAAGAVLEPGAARALLGATAAELAGRHGASSRPRPPGEVAMHPE